MEFTHELWHGFEHALLDSLKILPFLFITYLLMEYLEHKMTGKTKAVLQKSDKTGPVWGSLLGMLPQCGFSSAASNLYAGRMITMGTLIAIFLSTSDEMLPIMISQAVAPALIGKILLMKVVIAMIAGFAIDFCLVKFFHKKKEEPDIHHFCEHEHCHCENGIFMPAIRHTLQIWVFVVLISFVLNVVIEFVGTDALKDMVLNQPVIGELIAGVIGLIPNCASSIVITQLYLDGVIRFGTMMAGLLVGAGVGVLILLKVNDDKKETFKIIGLLYGIGVVVGMILNFMNIV